jgi:Ca-activated chloride channel homolog
MVAKWDFDADDARLSAYALGELEEAEREEVEALLARNPEARAFVQGLRDTVAALEKGFSAQSSPGLTDAQRTSILATTARPVRRVWPRYAAAAGLAVSAAAGAAAWMWNRDTSKELALGAEKRASYADVARARKSSLRDLEGLGYTGSSGYAAANKPATLKAEMEPAQNPAATLAPDVVYVGRVGATPGLSVVDSDRLADDPNVPRLEAADDFTSEAYAPIVENPFRRTRDEPRSTFSVDVDTASYANVRRFLVAGQLPPPGAVRIEELVNYFRYDYAAPEGSVPFSVTTDTSACPWNPSHVLMRIGLQGRTVAQHERNASNLVFLVDVSGSMDSPDKLPLVVSSLQMLARELDARDRIAVVVYAGASGLVLDSTSIRARSAVLDALERLQAGGSTNGGEGIRLAYEVARRNLVPGGTNRVILCTDGDFNVGVTSQDELLALIEEQRKSGVFLTVLGFGTGNLKDSTMEMLADKGNGNYAYVDGVREARKVLVEELGGTLEVIAKDVKLQIELNPAEVQAWRLVGYENRVLAHQDFADDAKDAGEIGAGHTVTALYELVPVGVPFEAPESGELRYREPAGESPAAFTGEVAFLQLRYKEPEDSESRLLSHPIVRATGEASVDSRFASAVAMFAMKLRGSPHVAEVAWADIERLASGSLGRDERGYRVEFLDLIRRASELQR